MTHEDRREPPPELADRTGLTTLRHATRSQHSTLHRHPLLTPLHPGHEDPGSLSTLLQAFYGFYEPWETRLVEAAVRMGRPDLYAGRYRTNWLERDLERAGLDRAARDGLPRFDGMLWVHDPGALAGALYVVEGSALGGLSIIRHTSVSSVFFTGHGEDTPARWRRVRRYIETACATATARNTGIETARGVFRSLLRWFDEYADARREGCVRTG